MSGEGGSLLPPEAEVLVMVVRLEIRMSGELEEDIRDTEEEPLSRPCTVLSFLARLGKSKSSAWEQNV